MTPNITATTSILPPQTPTQLSPRGGHAQNATPANVSTGGVRDTAPRSAVSTSAPAASPTAVNPLDSRQLLATVNELNQTFKNLTQTSLQFSLDDQAGIIVVKVMDAEKDEVIRQIPPEAAVEMAALLKELEARKTQHMQLAAPGTHGVVSASNLNSVLLRDQA